MRSTRTLIIVATIWVVGLLGLGTLAQRGEQDRLFERDGTRLYGRLNSVDLAHVIFNGKSIERSQVIMILFPGAMVPEASPSSQQSGAGTTDLVIMKSGDHAYGKVSRVTGTTVVQNGAQLSRTSVSVIEFDVSPPPGNIETVEPNEPTPLAPAGSPAPPSGYIPAQEKPGPSPTTETKPPAKDPKNPASKPKCPDLKPASPECHTAGRMRYGGYVWDGHSGRCAVAWSYCGVGDMWCGKWQEGPRYPANSPDPKWGDVCKDWALGEKKKKEGTAVCCDPVKSK